MRAKEFLKEESNADLGFAFLHFEYESEDGAEDEGLAIIPIFDITNEQIDELNSIVDNENVDISGTAMDIANNYLDVPGTIYTAQFMGFGRTKTGMTGAHPFFEPNGSIGMDRFVRHSPALGKLPRFMGHGYDLSTDDGKLTYKYKSGKTHKFD